MLHIAMYLSFSYRLDAGCSQIQQWHYKRTTAAVFFFFKGENKVKVDVCRLKTPECQSLLTTRRLGGCSYADGTHSKWRAGGGHLGDGSAPHRSTCCTRAERGGKYWQASSTGVCRSKLTIIVPASASSSTAAQKKKKKMFEDCFWLSLESTSHSAAPTAKLSVQTTTADE